MFIGNLEKEITIEELKEKLKTYGEILVSIYIFIAIALNENSILLRFIAQEHSLVLITTQLICASHIVQEAGFLMTYTYFILCADESKINKLTIVFLIKLSSLLNSMQQADVPLD